MITLIKLCNGGLLNLVRIYGENVIASIKSEQTNAEIAQLGLSAFLEGVQHVRGVTKETARAIANAFDTTEEAFVEIGKSGTDYLRHAEILRQAISFLKGFKMLLLQNAEEEARVAFERRKMDIEVLSAGMGITDEKVEHLIQEANATIDTLVANTKQSIASTFDPLQGNLEALIKECLEKEVKRTQASTPGTSAPVYKATFKI
jgi:hypothetical protein